MKTVIRQSKKDKNNKKYIIKWLTSNPKWVMLISSTREQNSQGGREYRKGKQERKVTPGNRIREIEMLHKPLDV
ncbi:hypothetical protein D7V96_24585 [bacterium D16-59]|nr:hypothetical protein D7V96_24585 [bacterium D16-59]